MVTTFKRNPVQQSTHPSPTKSTHQINTPSNHQQQLYLKYLYLNLKTPLYIILNHTQCSFTQTTTKTATTTRTDCHMLLSSSFQNIYTSTQHQILHTTTYILQLVSLADQTQKLAMVFPLLLCSCIGLFNLITILGTKLCISGDTFHCLWMFHVLSTATITNKYLLLGKCFSNCTRESKLKVILWEQVL